MLMWCLSGIVLMYVPYPTLSQSLRLSGLAPIDWGACCTFPQGDFLFGGRGEFQLEMLGPDPVLRLLRDEENAGGDFRQFARRTRIRRHYPAAGGIGRGGIWPRPGFRRAACLPRQRRARSVDGRRQLSQGQSAVQICVARSTRTGPLYFQPYRRRRAADHREAAILELARRHPALDLFHFSAGTPAICGQRSSFGLPLSDHF